MSSAKHIDIVSAIVKAHYAATGEQVQELAYAVAVGLGAGTAYLRVIVAHMQAQLGRGSRRRAATIPQEPVLDAIHEELYPHVLKGVGPDEMDRDERNSNANFARTMASTVRFFIQHGGDVRALDVPTVTKNGLRRMVQPAAPQAPEGASRALRGFITAREGLKRAVIRLARGDPERAREEIDQLLTEYEQLLDELGKEPEQPAAAAPAPDHGATTTIVGRTPDSRSSGTVAPMLHRGA